MIKSKKSISNFKLREGLPVMLQVTLRKSRAYDFVDRFVKLVLPRMRDFSGLSDKSFDRQANYTIGVPNYNIFPELTLDDIITPTNPEPYTPVTTQDIIRNLKQSCLDCEFGFPSIDLNGNLNFAFDKLRACASVLAAINSIPS